MTKKTRFQQEISGNLGEFWQKEAMREVHRAIIRFNEDTYKDETGALRWKSNDNPLPDDMLEKMEYAGLPVDREANRRARQADLAALRQAAQEAPIDPEAEAEKIAEMRAAFGAGVAVVDILTGRTYKL